MIFKLRQEKKGAHVHTTLWVAKSKESTPANIGNLITSVEEASELARRLEDYPHLEEENKELHADVRALQSELQDAQAQLGYTL